MSDYQTIVYEKDGAVASILMNRPETLNAFNRQLRAELTEALTAAGADPEIRAVVLGSTDRAFSSGADLTETPESGLDVENQILEEYRPALFRLGELDKPVIAAVPGVMAGIGTAFAMNCDLMVMADTGSLVMAFTNIGLVPDGGASWQLLRYLGYQRAFQLIAEGGRLSAQQCLEAGIANKVVPADQVLEVAKSWAAALAQRAPIALREAKKILRRAGRLSYADTVELEAAAQAVCVETEDAQEAVAAFLAKRQPVFRGR